MRYRKQDSAGDYVFGHGVADFYRDTPEAVAQAVKTRLLLSTGEWFLNTEDGTPWTTEVLGKHTSAIYDQAIQERIRETPGVTEVTDYSSRLDPDTRRLAITATISTVYGSTSIDLTL